MLYLEAFRRIKILYKYVGRTMANGVDTYHLLPIENNLFSIFITLVSCYSSVIALN